MFEPENDGVDHINIYSKGKTELGRLLSNFAYSPFTYEPYGEFNSVEGFWYWYFTGMKHNSLKTLSGFDAKKKGRECIGNDDNVGKQITTEDKAIILEAIRCKLRQNKQILNMLIENELPLSHYYCYIQDNGNYKIIDKPEYNWIIDEYNRIKKLMIQSVLKRHINAIRTTR